MENIIDYYSRFDEWGRLDREPLEFIINLHYIKKYLPTEGHIFDNGAGPGKYAMELAKLGYDVTLSDLTPRLVEVAQEKANVFGLIHKFQNFYTRNATQLDGISSEQFDATLMLGPFYHLQKEEERVQALKELYRVTKKGGYVFVAFQSRIRMLLTALQDPEFWKPLNNMDTINEFRNNGTFDHADQGRFTGAYYFNIDDIKPFMESAGFESVQLIGSSSIEKLLTAEQRKYWEEKGEYDNLLHILIELAKDKSTLGVSSHLLYIGRKL